MGGNIRLPVLGDFPIADEIRQKKNSCVSGSPTDPKISGPTLDFFFFKKKKSFFFFGFLGFFWFFFKFHSVTTHTQVQCGNNLLPLHPISPVQNLIY